MSHAAGSETVSISPFQNKILYLVARIAEVIHICLFVVCSFIALFYISI